MKRLSILFLIVLLTIVMLALPIYADDEVSASPAYESQTETFEDGSYAVIETIIYDDNSVVDLNFPGNPISSTNAFLSSASSKTADRTYTFYSNSGTRKWSITLKGHFTYTGSSAKATSASVSHKILSNGWSCTNTDHSVSGATAKATGTFTYSLFTKHIAIGMKCSANGTISPVNY